MSFLLSRADLSIQMTVLPSTYGVYSWSKHCECAMMQKKQQIFKCLHFLDMGPDQLLVSTKETICDAKHNLLGKKCGQNDQFIPSAHQMPTHPLNFGNCFGLQMWSPQITSHPLSCSTPNSEHFWASDSVTLNEKLANI